MFRINFYLHQIFARITMDTRNKIVFMTTTTRSCIIVMYIR